MAFYRKVKQKGNNKWHPRAVNVGGAATTDEVAQRLSALSTVSRGDTYAVLGNLGKVLADLMNEGRSVRLMGMGTFYLTCRSEGKGVDTPEEVSPRQITSTQVRFIPEYSRDHRRRVIDRTLVSPDLTWVDIDKR